VDCRFDKETLIAVGMSGSNSAFLRIDAMPFVQMHCYLFALFAVIIAPVYAARFIVDDAPAAVVSKAEGAKAPRAPAATPTHHKRPPVWVVPTREYKNATPQQAQPAVLKEVAERKEVKKSKKRPAEKERASPTTVELGYAQQPPTFSHLDRD
jgi:hypothetical protein